MLEDGVATWSVQGLGIVRFFLAWCIWAGLAEGREFRSADLSQAILGEVVGLEGEMVSIRRDLDNRVFTSAISAFSEEDQNYIRSIHPGTFIDRITLRAETVQTRTKSFDFNTGRLHRSISVTTPVAGILNSIPYFEVRQTFWGDKLETYTMTGKTVRAEALTTAGEVRTRLMCFYLAGTQKSVTVVGCQYRDVILDLFAGDTFFHFDPVASYYGYVVCAINLDSGKVMALRGTKRNAERFVQEQLYKILSGSSPRVGAE